MTPKHIYFPQCCLNSPSGILVGTYDENHCSAYIVAVCHFPTSPKLLKDYLKKYSNTTDVFDEPHPLGIWICNSAEEYEKWENLSMLFRQSSFLCIKSTDRKRNEIEIDIFQDNSVKPLEAVVIIYNQKEILENECTEEFSDMVSDAKVQNGAKSIEKLFEVTNNNKNGLLSYKAGMSMDVKVTHCRTEREISIIMTMLTMFSFPLFHASAFIIQNTSKLLERISSFFPSLFGLLHRFLSLSSFYFHTSKKFKGLFASVIYLSSRQKQCQKNSRDSEFRCCKNRIASFVVDIVLGLLVFSFVMSTGIIPENVTKLLMPYVEIIAKQVETLVQWLMGIPAGLKLNDPLNQFLGRFFLYHVRIWLEYARLMLNMIPHLIVFCLMSSCLGFSVLLSIIADNISILSFHVYCFYVYACRLYNLQLAGLISLWRLFRGKKWNPLRQRVDSLEDSGQRPDQLFVGTLLFTVLLFLLPTTALYYAIFVVLRVLILAIQVFMGKLMYVLATFPSYSVALHLLQISRFVKTVNCQWIYPTDDLQDSISSSSKKSKSIVIHMRTYSASLLEVIAQEMPRDSEYLPTQLDVQLLLGKIISGDLIRWS